MDIAWLLHTECYTTLTYVTRADCNMALSETVLAKSANRREHKLVIIQTQETCCILVCQISLQEIVGKPGCRERLISVPSCAEK
jgi:hypothetical protein